MLDCSVSHTWIFINIGRHIFRAVNPVLTHSGHDPLVEMHDVINSDTVDDSVVFSPPVKPMKKKKSKTVYCSWPDSDFFCKADGWPNCQDQAPTKSARPWRQFLSWWSHVVTSSCDARGTFSQLLKLWKTWLKILIKVWRVRIWAIRSNKRGGTSSVGRACGLVIGKSRVQIPTPPGRNWTTCRYMSDVQLAPCVAAFAMSKGSVMSWWFIQGVPYPRP